MTLSALGIDLHVHSPASACFCDAESGFGARALDRAAAVGLELIAVTDHHSFEGVDLVRGVRTPEQPRVLPGVEINRRVSGAMVYFIALFPEDAAVEELRGFLHAIGIPRDSWGSPGAEAAVPPDRIRDDAAALGGLLISSRADKNDDRRRALPALVNDLGFRAFDLVWPDSRRLFAERWPDCGPFHFLQFSDSHRAQGIGEPHTLWRTADPGFDALKSDLESDSASNFSLPTDQRPDSGA